MDAIVRLHRSVTGIAAILLGIMSLIYRGQYIFNESRRYLIFGWISSSWIFYVLFLAAFPGIVGHAGISAVLRWFPPIIVSVAYLFEPLIGSIIGWLLGTTGIPSLWTWVGAIVLIIGTVLVIKGDEALHSQKEA